MNLDENSPRPGTDRRRTMRRALATVAGAALLAGAGCAFAVLANSAEPVTVAGSAATAEPSRPFAVFANHVPAAGWTLAEGVHPTGASAAAFHKIDPGMDWFAEYYGPAADLDDQPYVQLTGRTEPLPAAPTNLAPGYGRGEIGGRAASWSSDPSDPLPNAVVTIAWDDGYSLAVSGTRVGLDELRRIAAEIRPATEAEWIADAGVTTRPPR